MNGAPEVSALFYVWATRHRTRGVGTIYVRATRLKDFLYTRTSSPYGKKFNL
jgi:hypothetical protein